MRPFRIALVLCCLLSPATSAQAVSPILGAAATVHPLATSAALETLEEGGNAIDAAVAAALMLNVVNGYNSGIGGGCFILIHKADGSIVTIDGRETAPAAATRDMYLVDGKADPELSQTGPLASGVPGALAAYSLAIEKNGQLALANHLRKAARVAEQGFIVDRGYAGAVSRSEKSFEKFEGSRTHFFRFDGKGPSAGDLFPQPDLANTLNAIAEEGTDWFYRGPFAKQCANWMKSNGGIITEADFAAYRPKVRTPVRTPYRGHEIIGFPPPSSGGIHVAQILNILEHFDLAELKEADRLHVIAEAMKLAFADRAYWLGDADFTKVPLGLIDREYAAKLAKKIKLDATLELEQHHIPPGAESQFFGNKHTTHIATMDTQGNWVAITATINTTFGSKVVIPGTGVVMNNEMDDFSAQPGAPNAFGLLGAEANKIEPGKRPLSSMSPTIVLKDGKPVFTCGAAGGPKIITQVVQALVNRIDLGKSASESIASPRIHHQWRPRELVVETRLPSELVEPLERRGHNIRKIGSAGVSQAIGLTPEGIPAPAFDPRVSGAAGVTRGYADNEKTPVKGEN